MHLFSLPAYSTNLHPEVVLDANVQSENAPMHDIACLGTLWAQEACITLGYAAAHRFIGMMLQQVHSC